MSSFERYSRQIMLPEIGAEGQKQIERASVLIIGLGGLGSPVATYLTGAGIGTIGLCDADVVAESNLQRQVLYETSQIGKPKVMSALKRLKALSPHTLFNLHPEGLTEENAETIISGYDIVVDCTDNFKTRYLIDKVCQHLGKSWIYGAIGEFVGQVAVFTPESHFRFHDLYPERGTLSLPQEIKGVIGPLPGVIGALQAAEALKMTAGFGTPLAGYLFRINLLTLSTERIEF